MKAAIGLGVTLAILSTFASAGQAQDPAGLQILRDSEREQFVADVEDLRSKSLLSFKKGNLDEIESLQIEWTKLVHREAALSAVTLARILIAPTLIKRTGLPGQSKDDPALLELYLGIPEFSLSIVLGELVIEGARHFALSNRDPSALAMERETKMQKPMLIYVEAITNSKRVAFLQESMQIWGIEAAIGEAWAQDP